MTGAMYAAVAGLRAHMSKLNVIGNNVANVNTAGYKASRMLFTESIYTTLKSGSNGTPTLGGTNPSQVGYGCQVGTIDLDMSSKNYNPTGRAMDMMLDGEGFFLVGDKTGGITSDNVDALKMTRLGRFDFINGYMVDGEGNVVYGFLNCSATDGGGAKADYNANGATVNGQTPGVSTELVPIRLPLAARGNLTDIKEGAEIYPYVDDTGHTHDAKTEDGSLANAEGTFVQLDGVSISPDGKITGTNKITQEPVVIGYVAIANVDNPNGVTHIDGPYYQALDGAGSVHVATVGNGVKGYLNNKKPDAGDDAPSSLDMIGGTGDTTILTGGLESSGTDLANEITEMITTQRGYQANTRIITVTDSMLEELVNMKR